MQGSDFWQPCAPPKSCRNQKSFWDPSTYHPNTTGLGWVFFISKKHVLVGHPSGHVSWLTSVRLPKVILQFLKQKSERGKWSFLLTLNGCLTGMVSSILFGDLNFIWWALFHLVRSILFGELNLIWWALFYLVSSISFGELNFVRWAQFEVVSSISFGELNFIWWALFYLVSSI